MHTEPPMASRLCLPSKEGLSPLRPRPACRVSQTPRHCSYGGLQRQANWGLPGRPASPVSPPALKDFCLTRDV